MLLCLFAASVQANTLLDFRSDSCGPCRQMDPIVAQLEASGQKVVRCNDESDQAIFARFGVQSMPTFIVVSDDGHELDRHVGGMSLESLRAFANHGTSSAAPKQADEKTPRPEASICRVTVTEKGDMVSKGSGSLLLLSDGYAIVVTNHHVIEGGLTVSVRFPDGQSLEAEVIDDDDGPDLAALLITAPAEIGPLKLADHTAAAGEKIFCTGYGPGQGEFLVTVGTVTDFPAPGALGRAILRVLGRLAAGG